MNEQNFRPFGIAQGKDNLYYLKIIPVREYNSSCILIKYFLFYKS